MNDKTPPFELVWHDSRQPEQHQHFATREAALNRSFELRDTVCEWTLFHDGIAIDWGYYAR